MAECTIASSDQAAVIQLTECDIPGAFLSEPIDRHTMPELRWWLLCRGIQTPTSWNKQKLLSRFVTAKCLLLGACYHDNSLFQDPAS